MPPALLHACTATPTVLVDIPSTLSAPPGLVPRSTHKPLAAPHALAEPKQQTPFTQALSALHARLLPALAAALADLHASYAGAYHSPRSTATDAPPPAHSELDFHACTSLLQPPGGTATTITLTAPTTLSDISDIHATAVTNASDAWLTLTLAHPSPPKLFHLPPRASFLLSRFQPAAAAEAFTAFAAAAAAAGSRRRFDFALLDPPWPNRSAARSAAYSTLSSRPGGGGGGGGGGGIHELLQLPLGPALAPGALVAVWITNKPRHRAFVVERLFVRWGVVEAGEWVWLKVTGAGEPVVALEAAMRKPYEVLVFGRKPAGGGVGERGRGRAGKRVKLGGAEEEEAGGGGGVGVGRVPAMTIVAVPDLHSRKPGVKELVEPYLPEDYRACEIFGRNLTEGWFTWGDEAIKFNWDGHWKPEAAEGAPTTTTSSSSSSSNSSSSSSTATAAENGDGGDGDEMTDE